MIDKALTEELLEVFVQFRREIMKEGVTSDRNTAAAILTRTYAYLKTSTQHTIGASSFGSKVVIE